MKPIEAFFAEIDRQWRLAGDEKVQLRVLGAGALLLQVDYGGGTKDSDILETVSVTPEVRAELLELAGPGTEIHTRHRLYAEIVPSGLPFLRQNARWNAQTTLNARLTHLEVEALDVVDVVVSKLKRYSVNDASDIEAMIDKALVGHGSLIACFREAVDLYSMDARAEDLPKYVANLHRVERDVLGVEPTKIELPSWIE